MLTAMAGAVTNIVLNLLLIPKWGAIGAAVATLVCYLLVYIIRAVNTKKYVSFDLHTLRLIINSLLLSAQMGLWFAPWRYGWIGQIIIPVLVLVFNGRGIFLGISKLCGKFFGKKSKKI